MVAKTKSKRADGDETIAGPAIGKTPRREMLRRAIMATADENGDTTPERVFEAAKDPSNPLHDEFVWNGEEAVRQLGLERAAVLIRTLKVEVVIDTVKIAAPFYVSDPRENEDRRYTPIIEVKRSEDMKRAVMLDELSRIEGALNRARAISGVLEISSEFEAMLESIIRIRSRLGGA